MIIVVESEIFLTVYKEFFLYQIVLYIQRNYHVGNA